MLLSNFFISVNYLNKSFCFLFRTFLQPDEQLMEVIGEVKGVGPALRGKIKEAIEAKFGSIGNGKKAEEQKGTAC